MNGSALGYMFQLLQGRKTSRLFSVSETLQIASGQSERSGSRKETRAVN